MKVCLLSAALLATTLIDVWIALLRCVVVRLLFVFVLPVLVGRGNDGYQLVVLYGIV